MSLTWKRYEEEPVGRIVVDEDRCKGCEICISVCPKKVIALGNHFNRLGYHPATMVANDAHVPIDTKHPFYSWRGTPGHHIDHHQCTGCGICARMCPDVAITVFRHKTSKGDTR